jgi:hypothetical protein
VLPPRLTRMHKAESAMTSNMSADTRRQIIDHIIEAHTQLANPNWWGPLDDPGIVYKEIAIAYREWATARAPTLRAELEALSDSVLTAEKERCNQCPEWSAVFSMLYEELERQEELDRSRQYHRSIAQKGGRAHRSTRQPPGILEACKDMYARNPKVAALKAHEKLSGKGHKMPDGRVIQFKRRIAFATFRTKYWPKRRTT